MQERTREVTAARLPAEGRGHLLSGLFRALRPRQWIKNVLVLAAPLAGGVIANGHVERQVITAFVLFCVSSSGVYLLNDAIDVEADRSHPRKRSRPIASGAVPVPVAYIAAVPLLLLAPAAALLSSTALAEVLLCYEAVQIIYCIWLKHEPVLDLAVVSSGFLLRAIAGAAATDVSPSQWFLLVAGFGSLFMVAGKRYAERQSEGDSGLTRASLQRYSPTYLRFVWTLSASVVVVAYSLWAFELSAGRAGWSSASVAPFLLALLRYAVEVDAGEAGEPEDILLRNRVLQALGVIWLVLLCLAVYD